MLPIKAWRIYYADGSTFSSADGTFAEAPPYGVACVVYYHAYKGRLIRTIDDGQGEDNDVFLWQGEGDDEGMKMGMWMDSEGLHRIHRIAERSTLPEPSK